MKELKKRHSICIKIVATVLVCLLSVNATSLQAYADYCASLRRNTLAIQSIFGPIIDAVGMRYPLLKQMMEHPMSQKAEQLFAKNWARVKGEEVSYLSRALGLEGSAEDSVH